MAQVYFKRRENLYVDTTTLNTMKENKDSLYFLTNEATDGSQSYLFYRGSSVAASPNPHYPLNASTADGKSYSFNNTPYDFNPTIGMTIDVKFTSPNTASSPMLNNVEICRRGSSFLSPITITSSQLNITTSYRLIYTQMGVKNYWVIQGMDKPVAADLYGTLPASILEVSTTDIGEGAPLSSNKLYVVYS